MLGGGGCGVRLRVLNCGAAGVRQNVLNFCQKQIVEAEELFRDFYFSLGVPLRSVFEYKMRRRGGSLSEVFEKPWLLLHYVGLEMGQHNAELLGMLFAEFAARRGVNPEVAAEALRGPEGWRRFVEYLRALVVINEAKYAD